MINDIKKSLNNILNERITSPFFGTFAISWIIWNWKILYATFFISESKLEEDKITYIVENFSDINYLITYPFISTVILIVLVPFITNGAYWVSLLFNQWKINKRNQVQKKELLTLEQSINLREQIKSQEKRFEELLDDKNLRIKQLEIENNSLKNSNDVSGEEVLNIAEKEVQSLMTDDANKIAERINNNKDLKLVFEQLSYLIQRRQRLIDVGDPPSTDKVNYFLANDIIENDENGKFNFTKFGKRVGKIIYRIEK